MQTQFLQRYAPNSLHLLFHPVDTGNPNYDFNAHLEKFANRRVDVDSVAPSSRQGLRLQTSTAATLPALISNQPSSSAAV